MHATVRYELLFDSSVHDDLGIYLCGQTRTHSLSSQIPRDMYTYKNQDHYYLDLGTGFDYR